MNNHILLTLLFHIVKELGEITGYDVFFCMSINYVAMIRQ